MKDKMPWAQKKDWPKEDPELQEKTNTEIQRLSFHHGDLGVLPLEDIDKILSLMEAYYSQYGLLQICIEIGFLGRATNTESYDDSYVVLDLDVETEFRTTGPGWNVSLWGCTIARFDQYVDEDYVEKAQQAGRDIYFALRDKHPLLTRDLYVPGYSSHKKVYEIVCEKCGRTRQRRRKCKITEHPERFICNACGGRLSLKN